MKPGILEYEALTTSSRAAATAAADSVLRGGWPFGPRRRLRLDEPLPWDEHTPETRSRCFHMHSLDMLEPLLCAYSEGGSARHLLPALAVAWDWVKHHDNVALEVSPFAWYDMAVGMRAYRIAYVLDAARAADTLTETQDAQLWRALERHQDYLGQDKNISFHNNHGFYQVAGQLAMGRRFKSQSPKMAVAFDQGRARLKQMLALQFAPDGTHLEHSPDYHRMVYEAFCAIQRAGLVEDEATRDFADRIEVALSWFVEPNGHIANFGDSDYHLLKQPPDDAARRWRTNEMRFFVTQGALGCPPRNCIQVFPNGGYFVARVPSADKSAGPDRASYLAMQGGFHSRTHKHADDLSLIWSEGSSRLLVDAGRFGYVGKTKPGSPAWLDGYWYEDPKRMYVESTRAHNTLAFDEKNYARRTTPPFGSALRRTLSAQELIVVEAEVVQFEAIEHVRMLVFSPACWLLVLDWYSDNSGATRRVKQWFHLGPELIPTRVNSGYDVPNKQGPALSILSLAPSADAQDAIIGEERPELQGFWSPTGGALEPNYAISLLRVGPSGTFATLFTFDNSPVADFLHSKLGLALRDSHLFWTSRTGRHSLRVQRPKTGSLSVDYSVTPP